MLDPFTQWCSGAGLSWLDVWASLFCSQWGLMMGVFTLWKLATATDHSFCHSKLCSSSCVATATTRSTQISLICSVKDKLGNQRHCCAHCHSKGGETGDSHLELIIFGTHTNYSGLYCRVPTSETRYEHAPNVLGIYFFFRPVHGDAQESPQRVRIPSPLFPWTHFM